MPPRSSPQAPRQPLAAGSKRKLSVGHVTLAVADPHAPRQMLAASIAADAPKLSEAVEDFRSAFCASKTVGSHSSQIKIYVPICKSANLEPFPISYQSMAGSVLKAVYSQ